MSWPALTGSWPLMPFATSSSAMPFTSSGCRPQKSAICSKVSEVLSTSQTAVALGISGLGASAAMTKFFPFPGGPVGAPSLRSRLKFSRKAGLLAGKSPAGKQNFGSEEKADFRLFHAATAYCASAWP